MDEEEDPDMAKRPTVTIRINAHVNGEGRFNLFLEPYTTAIKHVLTYSFSHLIIFFVVILSLDKI